MPARYRDRNAIVGNLSPGEVVFRPEPVETIPMAPYSADQIIAAHRQQNALRVAAPPRIAPFRTRSLRRS